MTITFGSVFSGIGVFDKAFCDSGMELKWQVEIDKQATQVLNKYWPDVPRVADIRDAGAHNLCPVDLVCGGFPCTDLSLAGKREGLMDGEQSSLYWEMLRVVDELQPEIVVWENVGGLSSSDSGRDLARVIVSLRERLYFGCGRYLDAQYSGVAQRRGRWFGVFVRGSSGAARAGEILSLSKGVLWHPAPGRKSREGIAGTIEARARGGGFPGTDGACANHIVAAPLTTIPYADNESQESRLVAHTLTGTGFDASEDGTGRGTPLVPVAYRTTGNDGVYELGDRTGALTKNTDPNSHIIAFDTTQVTSPSNYSNPQPGNPCHPLASTGHPPVIAMQERMESCNPENGPNGKGWSDVGITLEARPKPQSIQSPKFGVRRIIPLEAVRLMGLPDDYLDGLGLSDSAKYRLCGNAIVLPCAQWIGRRIVEYSGLS